MRNYSAFDADLTHQALNLKLLARLLTWMRPYRKTLFMSLALVIAGATMTVLLPVITGRVIIDSILMPGKGHDSLPAYGLIDATNWLANLLSVNLLAAAALLYIGFVLAQAAFMFAHKISLASCSLKALRDLRLDLFSSLERKPASFYDHVAVGRVMTRVTNDIENLFQMLTGFGMVAGECVPFVLALFLMAHISGELTGVVLLALPFAALGTWLFRRAMREIFRQVRNSVSALNQYMQEDLMGIQVVQLSGRESRNEREFESLNQDNRHQEYRAIRWETIYQTFNQSLGSLVTASIIWFGGGEVIQSEISLGAMVLFTQLIDMMLVPVAAIGEQINVLFRSMASAERIFQALDWKERLHEPREAVELPERLEGEVEFRETVFAYAGGEPVLKGVSFRIAPGEKLAVVGATGSGKSTLIRLLVRFYDFDDGMIFLDGIDVNRIRSNDLRRRVGVVLQDFHIFSGSVIDNITLRNPEVSRERAEWAARTVNAHRFISRLPQGYETVLAERGHNLSQGQQQLLAFARVLAVDPEILVLDEATSSIDTGTELLIQEALHKLTASRTSIIIAHRLQTIQECDRVLVLHHGEVAELGTHSELLAKRGIYHTLHELQFQDAAIAAELAGESEIEDIESGREWVEPEDPIVPPAPDPLAP